MKGRSPRAPRARLPQRFVARLCWLCLARARRRVLGGELGSAARRNEMKAAAKSILERTCPSIFPAVCMGGGGRERNTEKKTVRRRRPRADPKKLSFAPRRRRSNKAPLEFSCARPAGRCNRCPAIDFARRVKNRGRGG